MKQAEIKELLIGMAVPSQRMIGKFQVLHPQFNTWQIYSGRKYLCTHGLDLAAKYLTRQLNMPYYGQVNH